MKIGVVCEGPTDFYAIKFFFGTSLNAVGIEAEFEAIQPEMDNTQPEAGWGNVLLWLDRNQPEFRIKNYFEGGLFGGNLGKVPLDCMLIQLDTDILGEASFVSHVRDKYGHTPGVPSVPLDRANEIREVLKLAANFKHMTNSDIRRHVLAPAVESTENWCVAAFKTPTSNFELLAGQTLIDEFMSALEISESREANPPYSEISKNMARRRRFCEMHAIGAPRIMLGCNEFATIHNEIVANS